MCSASVSLHEVLVSVFDFEILGLSALEPGVFLSLMGERVSDCCFLLMLADIDALPSEGLLATDACVAGNVSLHGWITSEGFIFSSQNALHQAESSVNGFPLGLIGRLFLFVCLVFSS